MIPYCKLPDGRWTISLYTTHDDVDCGAIAKKYGGGGHRQASGFIITSIEEVFTKNDTM